MRRFVLGLALVFASGLSAAEPVTPQPRLVEDAPARQVHLLNGLYHFKTFPAMPTAADTARDSGLYIRLPGEWFNFLGQTDQVFDAEGKRLPKFPLPPGTPWKTADLHGLYEIAFDAPPAPPGATVLLNAGGCRYRAEFYLNGQTLGVQTPYENNDYDITGLLRRDGPNTLKIALKPYAEIPNAFGTPGVTRNITHGGILHDLRLLVLPGGVAARYALLETRHADNRARFRLRLDNHATAVPAATARLSVGRDGETLAAVRAEVAVPAGRSYIDLEIPLDRCRRWTPETPELYDVDFALEGPGGAPLASLPRERTGFRHLALDGAALKLNGVPRTLFGESGSRLDLLMNQCVGVYPEQQLSSMRSMGFTYVNLLDFPTQEEILRTADRVGIFLGPVVKYDADLVFRRHAFFPGLTRLDGKTLPDDELRLCRKQFSDLAERFALRPSVLAYVRMFNWLCAPEKAYNPHLAGRREPPDERVRFAEEQLAATSAIDPTRLNYAHHNGGNGPLYTHNRYWSCAVPLQEKADFPKRWAADASPAKMPLFVTEGNLMPGWPSLYPKWGASSRNPAWRGLGAPYAVREIGALDLGPDAYYAAPGPRAMPRAHAESITVQAAAHRWYGTLGHMMHTDSYTGYTPGVMAETADQPGDNVSGFVSRNQLWKEQHPSGNLTDFGRAMRDAFRPDTFYLMGPPDAPTASPRNHWSGEGLDRHLFAVNETGARRTYRFTLGLADIDRPNAAPLAERAFTVDAPPGFRELLPSGLTLPSVTERRSLRLTVTLDPGDGRPPVTRAESLSVFPRAKPVLPGPAGTVAVFDPEATLSPLLDYFGLAGKTVPLESLAALDGVAAVLVGRQGFTVRFGQVSEALRMGDFLRRGGQVLVFEQAGERLSGYTLDPRRARRAFPAFNNIPAFAGLAPEDLAHWRGGSSLLEPFPPAPPGFHWSVPLVASVDGVVASYVIEKPHLGNAVPLAESGFDLQFTPLLHVREGAGSVFFSQFDLTNRIGVDPAATRLAANLLAGVLAPAPAPKADAAYLGGEKGRKFLAALGRALPAHDANRPVSADIVLVAGDGAAPDAVRNVLAAGGTVLALPDAEPSAFGAVASPFRGVTPYASLEAAMRRTLPVSLSDTFWRDAADLPGLRPENAADAHPVLDAVPVGTGRLVYVRVPLELSPEHLYRMKPYRLWTSLLTELGIHDRRVDAGDLLARAGAASLVPLGGAAWFRLDPGNVGRAEKWQSPETPFDAGKWRKIVVPGAWEKTPYLENFGPPNPPPAEPNYDGVAYYRFEVDMPAHLAGRECVLDLGVVDDYDTVYLNGRKIGGLGPAFPMAHATSRLYRVPADVLRFGATNLLVVRVEDPAGDGGIIHGNLRFEFSGALRADEASAYLPNESIFEIFGVSPYYNEQW